MIVSYIHHYYGWFSGAEGVMDYNNLLMKLNPNFNLDKQVMSVTNEAISFEQVRMLSETKPRPRQTSKIASFITIVSSWKWLTIVAKFSTVDICGDLGTPLNVFFSVAIIQHHSEKS